MTEHLGYEKHDPAGAGTGNIRNGTLAKISNGPTEALNNLIKRVRRTGYGFRNFHNYRIRPLLYAGTPNWRPRLHIVG